MLKQIDGILYDTENSVKDKKFTYGTPGDDTGYEETLYITNGGLYFIYTNGGIHSKYDHEDITPIAREYVRDWILNH